MINYSLQTLSNIIRKCCTVTNAESTNIEDRYAFTINTEKLEMLLKQKKTNLHVIALNKTLESVIVGIEDIPLISEYVHDSKIYKNIFEKGSEFVSFMLFSTVNENGNIDLVTENEEGVTIPLTDKEIYENGNDSESLDNEFIVNVTKDLPCYRVLVIRIYNYYEDKFEYKILIRSNFNMVTFQKANKALNENENK